MAKKIVLSVETKDYHMPDGIRVRTRKIEHKQPEQVTPLRDEEKQYTWKVTIRYCQLSWHGFMYADPIDHDLRVAIDAARRDWLNAANAASGYVRD